MKQTVSTIFSTKSPLIGMIHLPPLPGYPKHPGMQAVIAKAKQDLQTLTVARFDGALVENDNDQPHTIAVTPIVARAFTTVMQTLLAEATIPVGMEVIYDMQKTMEIAICVGAPFVRMDVFADTVLTKWGIVPSPLSHLHLCSNKKHPLILADVQVKHTTLIEKNKSFPLSVQDTIVGGADGIIVTGTWTGIAPNKQDIKIAQKIASVSHTPVFIGSGATIENIGSYKKYVDGVIVGTSIKAGAYIDGQKARAFVSQFQRV